MAIPTGMLLSSKNNRLNRLTYENRPIDSLSVFSLLANQNPSAQKGKAAATGIANGLKELEQNQYSASRAGAQ